MGGRPVYESTDASARAEAARAVAASHLADCALRDCGVLSEDGDWSPKWHHSTGSASARLDCAELAAAEAARAAACPEAPVAPPAAPPTAQAAADANFRSALALGVLDPLLSTRAHDEWLVEPPPEVHQHAALLRARIFARMQTANSPGYHSELAGCLVWLRDFLRTFPGRLFMRIPLDDGDKVYNAGSVSLLFEWIRETGSRKPGAASLGKRLRSRTISGIISTLVTFLGGIAGRPLVDAGFGAELRALKKHAQHEDGAPGARSVEDPLRAQHLKAAFNAGFCFPAHRPRSLLERVKHAVLLFGHNTLARGACMGKREARGPVDPKRAFTCAAFNWAAAAQISPPAVVAWLHPSKDPTQTKPHYPMLVQRRSATAPTDSDPMCTFDALSGIWPILGAPVPEDRRSSVLFFRIPPAEATWRDIADSESWPPLTTAIVSAWVKEASIAAGIDPTRRASRALRMGGATDLYDIYGPLAERYIRERGRWGSDVAQIYQRVSAAAHGEMSRAIGDSVGPDLQSLLRGWSQAAVSHGRCPV